MPPERPLFYVLEIVGSLFHVCDALWSSSGIFLAMLPCQKISILTDILVSVSLVMIPILSSVLHGSHFSAMFAIPFGQVIIDDIVTNRKYKGTVFLKEEMYSIQRSMNFLPKAMYNHDLYKTTNQAGTPVTRTRTFSKITALIEVNKFFTARICWFDIYWVCFLQCQRYASLIKFGSGLLSLDTSVGAYETLLTLHWFGFSTLISKKLTPHQTLHENSFL